MKVADWFPVKNDDLFFDGGIYCYCLIESSSWSGGNACNDDGLYLSSKNSKSVVSVAAVSLFRETTPEDVLSVTTS